MVASQKVRTNIYLDQQTKEQAKELFKKFHLSLSDAVNLFLSQSVLEYRSKFFLRDLKKINFSDEHYSKYAVYLGKLLSDEKLPIQAKDHSLKGDWQGFREFHVSGDLLVVYKIKDDVLHLVRIGSHSQIFG